MSIFLPRHLCQFRRPDGKQWPGQIQGGSCDCWATIGAMHVRAARKGEVTPTPPDIRRWSGNPDCPGHIGYIKAAAEHYDVDVMIPHEKAGDFSVTHAEVISRLNKGQFVALQLHYGTLPPAYRAKTSFRGNHMFGLCPGIERGNIVRGDDPIRKFRQNYPLGVLFEAADVVARDLNYPKGHVLAAFTQGVHT